MKIPAPLSFGLGLTQLLVLSTLAAGCGSADDGSMDTGVAGSATGFAGSGSSGMTGTGGANTTAGTSGFAGNSSAGTTNTTTGGNATTGGTSAMAGATGVGGSNGNSGGTSNGGASAGGSNSGGSAGTASGGACTFTWDPPATFTSNGKSFPTQSSLDAVWDYQSKQDMPTKNQNWIMDQIFANKGSLNYCVRIDLKTNSGGGATVITAEQRLQYQQLLETWLNNWVETYMKGWGCWPYQHVPVSIVGWAVQSASTLGGTVDPNQVVYVNDLDNNGVPRCADACYRGSHQNGDYSKCTGGAAKHFDISLWLTYGMGLMGYGYDWGQQVDLDVAKYQHILGHEMGHGFGLPDFYSGGNGDFYTVETSAEAKALSGAGFIMQAGSAATVTPFDGWMLRQMWQKFERTRHAM